MSRAVGLADELLQGWANVLVDIDLVPGSKGVFEVEVDGTTIFSKTELGRHAEPGEVASLFEEHVGPRTFEG